MSKGFLSDRALTFTPSVIQETSRLAERCGAINLAEGFPDFAAPSLLKEEAIKAIIEDLNQYRHVPQLCELIAKRFSARHGSVHPPLQIDPATEVVITCGQTEAMAAAVLAVVNPGDEVVLFNPTYETYPANVAMAGGVVRHCQLYPPNWSFREEELLAAVGPRCKAIVVNSPHNPTGKVFTDAELAIIARVCTSENLLALTDEVYEDLTYDDVEHRSLASFPGMRERTVVTSSLSKTFSVTGWRIGWAIAPPDIASAISNLHVKLTDSAPAPFQEAAVSALQSDVSYYRQLRQEYQERRDLVCDALEGEEFEIETRPKGGFFVFARIPERFRHGCDDVSFVSTLIEEAGVAIVPGSIFFHSPSPRASVTGGSAVANGTRTAGPGDDGSPHLTGHASVDEIINENQDYCSTLSTDYSKEYVRVAICKKKETLKAAISELQHYFDNTD
ncbi:PLP-dependent transferases superfamilly protein [Klebsormidium nitens]|uniref:PLP-dependent transferases superfamilly protein n=1 Tax=Klebsormidium nitens TaxID=105231 RepID=A0A1Y1I6D5_KLENI|nr:PLP-dependent transferases superfamilly protein [Klebsormidium nitens]|eukprot:GAQ86073.1 PLP-dependent transferases superfamilly protein [Klebsormidium nitens]